MKSNQLDAQDSLASWMRHMNRRLMRMERKGRVDLLNSDPEPVMMANSMGEVPTLGDIPEDTPVGMRMYLSAEDRVVVQNAVTLAWEPAP